MGALLFALIVACIIVLGFIDALTSQSITGTQSSVNIILGMEFLTWIDIFGPVNIPWINTEWIEALWDSVTWNYWYFGGVNQYVRTLVALLITAILAWGFATSILPIMLTAASTALQGVRAGIGGLFSLFRR